MWYFGLTILPKLHQSTHLDSFSLIDPYKSCHRLCLRWLMHRGIDNTFIGTFFKQFTCEQRANENKINTKILNFTTEWTYTYIGFSSLLEFLKMLLRHYSQTGRRYKGLIIRSIIRAKTLPGSAMIKLFSFTSYLESTTRTKYKVNC